MRLVSLRDRLPLITEGVGEQRVPFGGVNRAGLEFARKFAELKLAPPVGALARLRCDARGQSCCAYVEMSQFHAEHWAWWRPASGPAVKALGRKRAAIGCTPLLLVRSEAGRPKWPTP